ncbi:MAG: hypothetical protein LBK13_02055, partial [Spirochaetales bacterium]|nr:hypothetical protein [Spirochaetales bacterium]
MPETARAPDLTVKSRIRGGSGETRFLTGSRRSQGWNRMCHVFGRDKTYHGEFDPGSERTLAA